MSLYTFGETGTWYGDELTDNIFVEMIHLTLPLQVSTLIQGSFVQHGAYLGPTGPRWAPCWSHELCYLGYAAKWRRFCNRNIPLCKTATKTFSKYFRHGNSCFKQIIWQDTVRYGDELTDNIFVEMIHLTLPLQVSTLIQGSFVQHGAYLGPTGPRWAPCWSHELCYLGYAAKWRRFCNRNIPLCKTATKTFSKYFRHGNSCFKQIIWQDTVRPNHLKHKFTSE